MIAAHTVEAPAQERWTPEQWQAIVHQDAATLVSAAAGSGKTSVLVRRIVERLTAGDQPADVDELLVVTFTKAAAAEMRQRLADSLSRALLDSGRSSHLERQLALLPRAQISTLHAFCLALLRQNFHRLELDPGFSELGEHEARLLKLEVIEAVFERRYAAQTETQGPPSEFLDLVDRFAGSRGDEGLAAQVLALHDTTRSLPDPDRWLDEAVRSFDVPLGARLEDLPLAAPLLQAARDRFQIALRGLERAGRLALGPAGPGQYAPILAEEGQALAALCAADTLDSMRRALQAVDFRRLPQVKAGECDLEVQAQVKKLRDAAKKAVKAYTDPKSLDSWLGNGDRERAAIAELRATHAAMRALADLVGDFEIAYEAAKRERAMIDFADQERLTLALLRERDDDGLWVPSDLARSLQARIREVLVDEYQDINQVQDAIIGLVCAPGPEDQPSNLFMVGDPKQSIYRFRHADPSLFRNRYLQFGDQGNVGNAARGQGPQGGDEPLATAGQIPGPRRIDLAANFRSRQEVVDAANFLFRQILTEDSCQMPYDRSAELVCGADYPPPVEPLPVEVHVIMSQGSQGVSDGDGPGDQASSRGDGLPGSGSDGQLAGATQGPAGPPADMDAGEEVDDEAEDPAIASAREREARLVARRIRQLAGLDGSSPAWIYDRDTRAMRQLKFGDVALLLRAANSDGQTFVDELTAAGVPAHAQGKTGYFGALEIRTMLALLIVLDNPRQDIELAAVLRSPLVDGSGLSSADLARIRLVAGGDFFDAVCLAAQPAAEGGTEIPDDLHASLAGFLESLDRWRTAARRGSLAKLVWDIYQETGFLAHVGGLPGGEQRRANLLALHDRAREFAGFERQGLSRFLRFIERLKQAGEDLGMAPALSEAADVVRVMSIHASKGLEFPVVFVCGLGKAFNEQDLRGDLLFDKALGLGPKVVDVERRLKYPSLALLAVRERLRKENLAEEIRLLYVAITRAKERLFLVGSLREPQAAMARWALAGDCRGWPLPADVLAGSRSYLDLIGLALARSIHGAAIREGGGPLDPVIAGANAPFTLELTTGADLGAPLAPPGPDPGSGDPVPGVPEALIARLAWRYPHLEATLLPAKIAVTEAARHQAADPDDESVPLHEEPAITAIRRKPRFLQDSPAALTAAERGTAAHLFMQHLDFRGPGDRAALERQLAEMQDRELLTPEMARAVPLERIGAFLELPLALRLRRASPEALWRELPFSMVVSAREVPGRALAPAASSADRVVAKPLPAPPGSFSPDERDDDEVVLLQGVIDAILVEPDGLVVVDWKTDSPKGRSAAQMAAPHRGQLALYRRAAEAMFRQGVKEGFLVFLQTGEVVGELEHRL